MAKKRASSRTEKELDDIVETVRTEKVPTDTVEVDTNGVVEMSLGGLSDLVERVVKTQVEEYLNGPSGPKQKTTPKTLDVVDVKDAKDKMPGLEVVGNGDTMQLLCKASNQQEGWMKSAKALEIKSVGCVVQFTTQQRNPDGSYSVAETAVFVPGTKIRPDDNNGKKIVPQNYNGD